MNAKFNKNAQVENFFNIVGKDLRLGIKCP